MPNQRLEAEAEPCQRRERTGERLPRGADLEGGAMGVIIQRMVEAEYAGLCLTRSPAADEVVVLDGRILEDTYP